MSIQRDEAKIVMKRVIVISAVKLTEGGPLSVLQDCLKAFSALDAKRYKVIALVYDRHLCNCRNISYIEIKAAKRSWFHRLYYEYFFFYVISLRLKPYYWLSLHDVSPNIRAPVKLVYCHNPSLVMKFSFNNFFLDYKITFFSLFYKFLYKINIKGNRFIIVQQGWLRELFANKYNLPKNKIVVGYPNIITNKIISMSPEVGSRHKIRFLYPAYSRFFKNFEVICKAVTYLESSFEYNFEVILTIDGTENRYSRQLLKKYSGLRSLTFLGAKSREEIFDLYENIDCLLFVSKLETWGLPLSEFVPYNKPIIAANKAYVLEAANGANKIALFDADNWLILASYMRQVLQGQYENFQQLSFTELEPPFASSWNELLDVILVD